MQRRHFLKGTLFTLPVIFSGGLLSGCRADMTQQTSSAHISPLQNKLNEILPRWEKRLNAKIGMAIINDDGQINSYRKEDYFPVNSTIKAFIVAHVLFLVDKGKLDLTQSILIKKSDLIEYSPVCQTFFNEKKPITIRELCEATTTLSDNAAANILLNHLGGLMAFNQFLKDIGADVVLSHNEPLLNHAHYGETYNTAKPNSYAQSLKDIITKDILSNQSKNQLLTWLINDKVADDLLRKHLPKNWRIGDKTGTGSESKNIVAVIWNAQNKPYFISLFITQPNDGNSYDFKTQKSIAIANIGQEIYPFL